MMGLRLGRTALVVRGVAAVVFGLLALVWPGLTLGVLVLAFGAYALVDGVTAVAAAIAGGADVAGRRGWVAVEGVIGIVAGIGALVWPGITGAVLLTVIAVWLIAAGIARTVIGLGAGARIAGVVATLFGIVLLAWPAGGALALAWLIGVAAIGFGVSLLASAWSRPAERPVRDERMSMIGA
jgi:uncharacterized membrane protein HdeD (DUF308 family)